MEPLFSRLLTMHTQLPHPTTNGAIVDVLSPDRSYVDSPRLAHCVDRTFLVSNHTVAGCALYNEFARDRALVGYVELPTKTTPIIEINSGQLHFFEGSHARELGEATFYQHVTTMSAFPTPRTGLRVTNEEGTLSSKLSAKARTDITEVLADSSNLSKSTHVSIVTQRELDRGDLYFIIGADFELNDGGYVCTRGQVIFGYMTRSQAAMRTQNLERQFFH